jgi:hypothetical protein
MSIQKGSNPERVINRLREIADVIESGAYYEYSEENLIEPDPEFVNYAYLHKRLTGVKTITLTYVDKKPE